MTCCADALVFDEISTARRIGGVAKAYLYNAQSAFLLLIELPSVIFPMLLEISRAVGFFTVNEFNLYSSMMLAIMLVRFFQEGQVIPALKVCRRPARTPKRMLVGYSQVPAARRRSCSC